MSLNCGPYQPEQTLLPCETGPGRSTALSHVHGKLSEAEHLFLAATVLIEFQVVLLEVFVFYKHNENMFAAQKRSGNTFFVAVLVFDVCV